MREQSSSCPEMLPINGSVPVSFVDKDLYLVDLNVSWEDTAHQQEAWPEDGWGDTVLEEDTTTVQNVAVLSLLLLVSLLGNLTAFSVIMFRKTRFGNGQFAVLILCLTLADLLTVMCGLMGGLIIEAKDMTWAGNSFSCGVYYFLTSWFLGLAAYLIVVLVGMLHVKRSTSWLARLQECRLLLLCLIVTSLLPALPELLIRSTVTVYSMTDLTVTDEVCIISAGPALYGFYVTLKLFLRHLLPLLCVVLSLLYPGTQVAKRLSSLFLGGGATCECGPCGTELRTPHACAKMAAQCRPDIVRDTVDTILVIDKGRAKTSISVREDPHRRRYKLYISYTYISTTAFYLLVEIIFQIQSAVSGDEVKHQNNLATAVYVATYLQLIISPCIFLYNEFIIK